MKTGEHLCPRGPRAETNGVTSQQRGAFAGPKEQDRRALQDPRWWRGLRRAGDQTLRAIVLHAHSFKAPCLAGEETQQNYPASRRTHASPTRKQPFFLALTSI